MTRTRKPDPKLAALRESGTVNPHAQDVQDPAFIGSDFFDSRDLVQVRYEMLRRVRTEGHAIAEVAARFGVSRPTFHKITDEVMRFIEEARAVDERVSPQMLVERIAAQFGLVVHRRTVERALARPKKKRQ